MNKTWEKRIERLQRRLEPHSNAGSSFRYGYVRRLPERTVGERYVAIAQSQATIWPGVELSQFDERIGRASEPHDERSFIIYLNRQGSTGIPA